jgi:hypothetical protein
MTWRTRLYANPVLSPRPEHPESNRSSCLPTETHGFDRDPAEMIGAQSDMRFEGFDRRLKLALKCRPPTGSFFYAVSTMQL